MRSPLSLENSLLQLADERWAQVWAPDTIPMIYDADDYRNHVVETLENDLRTKPQLRKQAAELLADLSLSRWIEAYDRSAE